MNKFHAKKTACAYGCLHASKKEAQRCNALHLLQEDGVISDLQTQVAFELMPFTKYPKLTLPRKWLPKACKPLGEKLHTLRILSIRQRDFGLWRMSRENEQKNTF